MIRILAWALAVVAFVFHAAKAGEPVKTVSSQEAEQWLRWVIPLPKQASIPAARVLRLEDVTVRVREGSGDIERRAAEPLSTLFPGKGSGQGRFEILVGVCGPQGQLEEQVVPEAAELAKLPNREQSYLIAPLGENRLALTAARLARSELRRQHVPPAHPAEGRRRQSGTAAGPGDRLAGPARARTLVVQPAVC